MSCEDYFTLKWCFNCKIYKDETIDFRKGRNQCKECNNKKARCEHGRQRNVCKECGGASICEHGKRRSCCKECGGSGICEHGRLRSSCKECGGSSICEHGRIRSSCKECGGASICEHGRIRSYCKECGGSSICEHGRQRKVCKECGGNQICEHGKQISSCKECGGSSICEHGRLRNVCKECGGASICEHGKRRQNCITCNPDCSCTECKSVLVSKTTFYYPLCQACFCNKYPDHEKSTLYKIKERYLTDELRKRFNNSEINMIFDKTVEGGCSRRRPDVLIDCLTHSIVIECDEYQHVNYECENKRTVQLFQDLGNRPLVLIRFNPDQYVNENDEKVQGCFTPLTKVEDYHKKKFYDLNENEWLRRISILETKIKEYLLLETFPSKEITQITLFYSHSSTF